MSKILVVGASGSVGSGIAAQLKEQGHQVRTTTSKKADASADKVYLDVVTGEGLVQAFDGIERAFLMSPGGYADQYKVLSPLIQQAKRQGLKKVVLLSAFGADADDNAPLRRSEIELEKSGVPYNVIRPNWFMQNFNTFWVHGIREQGVISLPVGDAKTSFIDTRDISAVGARLLASDEFNNRAFNLTGAEAITHAQVAAAIGEATGKKVVFADSEPAQLKQGLLSGGVAEDYADFLLLIMGYLKAGYNSAVNNEVKNILGREPIGFQQYVADHRAAFVQ
jgi:uncharacterized protein YbjT (DUF2867 family)